LYDAGQMAPPYDREWLAGQRPLVTRLYRAADCARWDVSEEAFGAALARSVRHRFPEGATESEIAGYLETLHVADLGLACACRAGHPAAWDHFVLEYRPLLYAAAKSIAGESYRELADSLYAELYGVTPAGGTRESLLNWFHGRSRLLTWLRSVLVQRQIDSRRAPARFDPFDEQPPAGHDVSGPGRTPHQMPHATERLPDPDRRHALDAVQSALDAATAALDARTRLRLRLYYGEDLTLAQIGRITGEHEATVSRKLARARAALRTDVIRRLEGEHGLSQAAITECLAYAADAPELHLTRLLSEE
jgi:RNA polymerase sigma-70 factor (ECF subfamily)